MDAIQGFNEQFGIEVERNEYVSRVLKDLSKHFGYQQIRIPIIEKAESYSEDIVGESPWPEWNPKGCFFFEICNYSSSYEHPVKEKVLLIPEGTVSVTRWLGKELINGTIQFPLRLSYHLNCYRNELINSLHDMRRREFTQFGLEILGSDSLQSDAEILCMVINSLNNLGIRNKEIRIRLNDISIFKLLLEESNLQEYALQLKELLDSLAEAKAGKNAERKETIASEINSILSNASLSPETMYKWDLIIGQENYNTDFFEEFGFAYETYLKRLIEFYEAFQDNNVNLVIDLCVIRSHEYYTSISFEIDIITDNVKYIEIAGGGRYDHLVGKFIPKDYNIQQVSSTGFAFGMERLVRLLTEQNRISKTKVISSYFSFDKTTNCIIAPVDSSIHAYINAFLEGEKNDNITEIQLK